MREDRKPFGIRFEKRNRQWQAVGVFELDERRAAGHDFTGTKLKSIRLGLQYPGCPHCDQPNFGRCHCGELLCTNFYQGSMVCPWCQHHGQWQYGTVSAQGIGDQS